MSLALRDGISFEALAFTKLRLRAKNASVEGKREQLEGVKLVQSFPVRVMLCLEENSSLPEAAPECFFKDRLTPTFK